MFTQISIISKYLRLYMSYDFDIYRDVNCLSEEPYINNTRF